MTDVEAKALALINEERAKTNNIPLSWVQVHYGATAKALCRTLEQHEAFKQKVSDAIENEWGNLHYGARRNLSHLIIIKPKPDPLVDVLADTFRASLVNVEDFRAALEARGLEIREKGQ
jgi:hypothetical protein